MNGRARLAIALTILALFVVALSSARAEDMNKAPALAPLDHVISNPIILNSEITFISGITSDEKVAATSDFTWRYDDPATYITSSFVTLDVPLSAQTFATGINATGQIVGYYTDTSNYLHGFLYSGGSYSTIDDPSGTSTRAWGINAMGWIVGDYRDSSNVSHGFLYSGGIYTTLDDPKGTKGTAAQGIDDSGAIVGTYVDGNSTNHGFIRAISNDYWTVDHPLGIKGTTAVGFTGSGPIVGSYLDGNGVSHGFLYSGGIYTTLDHPLAATFGTFVTGANLNAVVGSYFDSNGAQHGFIYSGGRYYTLDDPLGTSGPMGGINFPKVGIGQIVGTYRAGGAEHGLLYSPSQAFKWGPAKLATGGGNVTYWFDTVAHNWTTSEKNALISGLALWSAVANISFSEAASASVANITFRSDPNEFIHTTLHRARPATIGSGTTGGLTHTGANINFHYNVGAIDDPFEVYGNIAPHNTVHEEGHAIGLGHGGPYEGGGDFDPSTQQFSAYDYGLWAIMSYVEAYNTTAKFFSSYSVTGTDWGKDPLGHERHSTTPMILDILAAQRIYGPPTSGPLAKGGQIFGFNSNIPGTATDGSIHRYFDFTVNTHPIVTIWDGGTNNTLDLSGWSAPAVINLTPGTFSSTNGMVNNIAIAPGTVIDHVIGGTGDDVITGSSANDTITGGGGNDTIDGGGGIDTVVYRGPRSSYSTIKYVDGSLTIKDLRKGSPDGVDRVKNVERIRFSDQTVDVAAIPVFGIMPK